MEKTVIELFAGVGGFRVGLNEVKLGADGKAIEKNNFRFLWANQWEPSTSSQEAFECYKKRFDKGNEKEFSNIDISLVDKNSIPDFTLLTGGFPCQDYSVAHSLSTEKGIEGKKGVLWWQINDILKIKKPPYVLLENVDRLLKSPSSQRGRDFGIMLRCFYENDYSVEWRVINAADYGMPQKRKRTYIFAYKNTTVHAKDLKNVSIDDVIEKEGLFAKAFNITSFSKKKETNLTSFSNLVEISNSFKFSFENAGFMRDGTIQTESVIPHYKDAITLSEILEKDDVNEKFFLNDKQLEKFKYLKGSKRIERETKSGHKYFYSEGSMNYPDSYDKPGRTMLTSEGTINRSTHVVADYKTGKYRCLTPVECERLNQFPDNWTNTMSDKKRYFMMGNALVTGVIKEIGKELKKYIEKEN